jgi:sugar/nucleoside kinase (ribokinase family)
MRPPNLPNPGRPFDAVSFGYNSVDYLCLLAAHPPADAKVPMEAFARQGGGQAATAAATLARLGWKTRYLGKFGDGDEGRFARESLVAEGVDVAACRIASGVRNQTAVIWAARREAARTVAYLREPGLEIAPGEIAVEHAVAGAVLLLDGHHLPISVEFAHAARQAGIPVLLDAGKPAPGMAELLELTDYVLCDERFAPAYTGESDQRRALAAIAARHRTPFVAATLGPRGSLALVGGRFVETPAFAVDVTDTTGAGDVWHGAFAAGLLRGFDGEEILRYAAGAAALKCRSLGGRAGIPTPAELEDFLRHAVPHVEAN